jgi:hypothetical protein
MIVFLFLLYANNALAAGIIDRANFFSTQTRMEALSTIQELAEQGEDVSIDVYDAAPSRDYNAYAKSMAPKGTYIVISRNPDHVEVIMKQSRLFFPDDRDQLAAILINDFKNKDFNGGIKRGLSYLKNRLPTATNHKQYIVLDILVAMLVGLGLFKASRLAFGKVKLKYNGMKAKVLEQHPPEGN